MMAATHPERVSALIQYGTYARLARADDNPEGVPVESARRFWDHMIERWGEPASIDYWAPSAARDPEVREWWARMLRSGVSPGAMRAIGAMYEELDVRPLLATVRVPTLVLYRTGDRVVRPALSRAVAEGIPDGRAVELGGADHLFLAGDQRALLGEIEEFLTGRPAALAPDRILATVLSADIVRSTDLAAALGDRRWGELLGQYKWLAAREVERHRGRLVKWIGDGLLAAFDGPARAVRCALAIRAGAHVLGLEVRSGVHTGECEAMGEDLTGIAVHLTARLMRVARPAEVIASGTVKDLVVGSGLRFEDRGTRSFQGVPGEWALYAAAGDDERAPLSAPAVKPARSEVTELSRRELDVLALVAEGLDNETIAARLHLSVRTVERHLSNVYAKLRVSGKSARAAAAARFSSSR
jgi:class 3 adenylate cyclase/DNA-binding CsgD family transcriptional regulator